MARFETDGLNDIMLEMERMGEQIGPTADAMLMAAAEEVKQAWKQAIREAGLVDTGDMVDSIGYAKKPKTVKDIRVIDIYPQGKDRKGIRNAEKAFVLHYGAEDRHIDSTFFVDRADELSAPRVQAVFEKTWNDFLELQNTKHTYE